MRTLSKACSTALILFLFTLAQPAAAQGMKEVIESRTKPPSMKSRSFKLPPAEKQEDSAATTAADKDSADTATSAEDKAAAPPEEDVWKKYRSLADGVAPDESGETAEETEEVDQSIPSSTKRTKPAQNTGQGIERTMTFNTGKHKKTDVKKRTFGKTSAETPPAEDDEKSEESTESEGDDHSDSEDTTDVEKKPEKEESKKGVIPSLLDEYKEEQKTKGKLHNKGFNE
jgi:hypothetical protein